VISVPSGNFGNICAGLLANASGLPVQHFIAACNINDAVPEYLRTGIYKSKIAVPTISNAMDVGSPSNFIRILELFHNNYQSLKNTISGYSISDEETIQTIRSVFLEDQYMLDPHGAVAFHALEEWLKNNPNKKGFILETAHPVKFPETVEAAIEKQIDIPSSVLPLFTKQKQSIPMQATFMNLKEWLLQTK
jgi:threonine synthase